MGKLTPMNMGANEQSSKEPRASRSTIILWGLASLAITTLGIVVFTTADSLFAILGAGALWVAAALCARRAIAPLRTDTSAPK